MMIFGREVKGKKGDDGMVCMFVYPPKKKSQKKRTEGKKGKSSKIKREFFTLQAKTAPL